MSKKSFRSQASSSRAASGAFGGQNEGSRQLIGLTAFGGIDASPLSYIYEPPDLTDISDPNIVVALKNIQKKDSTTKARGLEELQTGISTNGEGVLDEALLEAWVRIFPRTSIDNSRRVRQLAHSLQGQIASAYGKRLAKHMPSIIPTWLAGLHDPDKSVYRAAQESFSKAFSTEEKMRSIWRVYQTPIIEYLHDVVTKESQNTLSDERTTSPDDAATKYSRVVGCAVIINTRLLELASPPEINKSSPISNDLFQEAKLWKLACHDDAFVRRSIYRLLVTCLEKDKNVLDLAVLSANVLTIGLHTVQVGSSLDYARALIAMTEKAPLVWTEAYQGKGEKSAARRLRYFLSKGSQGGPPEFWASIPELFSKLASASILVGSPGAIFNVIDDEEASTVGRILEALQQGISSKDEPRTNSLPSWNAYLELCKMFLAIEQDGYIPTFLNSYILPLIRSYVDPSLEGAEWAVTGPRQHDICAKASLEILKADNKTLQNLWSSLSKHMVEKLQTSLPEQSKDYIKSQESVADIIRRWYLLQVSLKDADASGGALPYVKTSLSFEIESAISALENRNGKPFAAAVALETSFRLLQEEVLETRDAWTNLASFVEHNVSRLITSPSAANLIKLLDMISNHLDTDQVVRDCFQELRLSPNSAENSESLRNLLSLPAAAKAGCLSMQTNSLLNQAVEQAILNDNDLSWRLVNAAIENEAAPNAFIDEVLARLTDALSVDSQSVAALHGLENSSRKRNNMIKEFVSQPENLSLLTRLLFLASADEPAISNPARRITAIIENTSGDSERAVDISNPLIRTIKIELDRARPESLPVRALINQAQKLFDQARPPDLVKLVRELIPHSPQWTAATQAFLSTYPNPSLACTNVFGSAVCRLHVQPEILVERNTRIPTDREGRSVLWRWIEYLRGLIVSRDILQNTDEEQKIAIFVNLSRVMQLAADYMSVPDSLPLWDSADKDIESGIVDSLAETQRLVASWLHSDPMALIVPSVLDELRKDFQGSSPFSYYSARAHQALSSDMMETYGHVVSAGQDRSKSSLGTNDILARMSLFLSSDSKDITRPCNELLSEMTTIKFQTQVDADNGLQKLLLLNCLLERPDEVVNGIPQQRLVFFVQHMVAELDMEKDSILIREMLRSLLNVLKPIKDIYGSFWEKILAFLSLVWALNPDDLNLPCIDVSLRLLALLRQDAMLEANDDLLDAWQEKKEAISTGLVSLLENFRELPDDLHQPRRVINFSIKRQLSGLDQLVASEEEGLYAVMAAPSVTLQETAYDLLHKIIPSKQEQASFDKALTKDFTASLPEILLSLIVTPPRIDELTGQHASHLLRSYLLSWILTFDHWKNASNFLQGDYAKSLTEGNYLHDLLELMFEILLDNRHKPVDASAYDVETYALDAETPERDTSRLLMHLFYLCLRHLPIQTKTWWRDDAPRQINIAVESWTEKFFSKLIIASELNAIKEWALSETADEHPMTVKISPSAHEVTASIPVDKQAMSIAIRLPPSYPLARAEVEGTHRIGVPEKEWASWIRNAQGQLTIVGEGGSNALIDCLLAWRKNVIATIKGQSECAICYSAVGADRSLPSKVCKTCKNKFHNSCLFRWFSSSNSSSCPLCRNTFTYS